MDLTNLHTFTEVFLAACTRYRDNPAFTYCNKTLTFGDVDRLSAKFCKYLQNQTDLQIGDRIAVQLGNTLQYPVAIFGILRSGMILVNTNPRYTEFELEYQLKDSGAKGLVTSINNMSAFMRIHTNTEVKHTIIADDYSETKHCSASWSEQYIQNLMVPNPVYLRNVLKANESLSIAFIADPSDVVMLQYTGGTTGIAKGAMLTHKNIVSNIRQMLDHFNGTIDIASETFVAPLPLYHIYGFSKHCMMFIVTGNHSLLIDSPYNIDTFINIFKRFKVTGFVGLSTLFNKLESNDDFKKLAISHLKITFSGGSTLPNDIAERWKKLTGCKLIEGYGMTETSPVISINPPNDIRQGTVGTALKDTELRIIDENGHIQPSGTPGEIQVRGPQVMKGYWNHQEETSKVLNQDNWLSTGDIGVLCKDNYLKIIARKKDVINVSGFNVYPSEIEAVVINHPYILDVAAVSIFSKKTGEAIKLYVVKKKNRNLPSDNIIAFCRKYLAAYKIPSHIDFLDKLPKSNIGKILRNRLKTTQDF